MIDEVFVLTYDLSPFLHFHYKSFIDSSSAFQHRFDSLSFFVCLLLRSVPFLVPIILSLHLSLGFRFKPANLNTPVTYYGLSYLQLLLNHISDDFIILHISI